MKKISYLLVVASALAACLRAPELPHTSGCEIARLVENVTLDVPLDSGVALMPGTHYTKGWKLENIGTCPWSQEFVLAFSNGEGMNSPSQVPLLGEILPGQSTTIAVPLIAPHVAGVYSGEWALQNAQGDAVEVEGGPLAVEVEVAKLPEDMAYDFLAAHCLAQWNTGLAIYLPCEGLAGERIGWVTAWADAYLEDVRISKSPVLAISPDNQDDGFIQGIYPPITVRDEQRFKARIGCLGAMQGCELIFQLNYEIVGEPVRLTLAEWQERYDGTTAEVDVDLSPLVGEIVRFILEVRVNGGATADAQGYWLAARIENH